MNFDTLPIFNALPADHCASLRARAQSQVLAAGDVLCYQGDTPRDLCLLTAGECALERHGNPGGTLAAPAWLDPVAVLGGLPHGHTIRATSDGECLCWPLDILWALDEFARAARRFLATTLQRTQDRLAALEAPIHYTAPGAQVQPGPFMFEHTTLLLAFCDADFDAVRAQLPAGLSLLRRPGRQRDSLILALADFPNAYPEHAPEARFSYTETTCFVPVRYGRRVGLFVPYIYPSAWEPILLGREIYGFPKRLGQTTISPRHAALAVDGQAHFSLGWKGMQAADEPRLVRALMDWLGLEGRSAALAFRAGEVLRQVMQLPPYRSIAVYNHKRIPAPASTHDTPTYAVDQLTHAIFGVLRWYQIAALETPRLRVAGGPLAEANLHLREAYRTQLDMRLSTGRVVEDYTYRTGPK